MIMTGATSAMTEAEARREAQRKRCAATLLKKACPSCGVARLWRGPTLGAAGKITCMNCGSTYRSKSTC